MKRIQEAARDLWIKHAIYVIILGGLTFGALHAMSRFLRHRKAARK